MYPELTGFNTKSVTLYCDSGIAPGMAVALRADGIGAIPASGEKFCGICTDVRGRYITAALTGYAEATYSGTAPTVGYNTLAGDGNGNVCLNDAGRELLIAGVDTSAKKITIIL
ncbi:MAG: hypothetical protein IJW86_07470 [Clostridia bacterium]|nr:hypothetical protein [Clostridia bacterium]